MLKELFMQLPQIFRYAIGWSIIVMTIYLFFRSVNFMFREIKINNEVERKIKLKENGLPEEYAEYDNLISQFIKEK